VGHITRDLGKEVVEVDADNIPIGELIERLQRLSIDPGQVGFSRFNTLAMVEDGEAFVAASKDVVVKSGDRVVLIPISHGG
jgi:molybdopterin converting factor small subunit